MLWIVLAALVLSLADAAFLFVVAGHIGALQTVGLVVLTALLGMVLVRNQGRVTLLRLQRRLQQGEAPTDELIDGVMIVFGAGLLITPGLVTDLTGFLLIIPVTRYPLRYVLRRWLVGPYVRRKIESGEITVDVSGSIGGWPGDGGESAGNWPGQSAGNRPDDGWPGRTGPGERPDEDHVDLGPDDYEVVDEDER